MGLKAKDAFGYGVGLDQFYSKMSLHIKLHIWANMWKNLKTTHTFRKTCNNELICRNLISSNVKKMFRRY